ncbi:MAG: DUF255 domain-containing protein [Acidobacteriia bacterium]|nr:DUF255 domain-containing protein [Terriglobia bacterium]
MRRDRIAGAVMVVLLCVAAVGQRSGAAKASGRYSNHLVGEKSPYLLLHAHNPVDWYPWGEEAFAKARRENKPIFLSIGYYTCHWCHVMERESYANPAIAALLNKWFVAVKVDREERPDVDRTYIAFLEATTGGAGWPANVFLTPDLKPFFGGTYFPPEDRQGLTGLKSLLPRVAEMWRAQQEEIKHSASSITLQLGQSVNAGSGSSAPLSPAVLDTTYQQIKRGYDAENGGFGSAPKFARSVVMEYLLRYWWRTGDKEALDMTFAAILEKQPEAVPYMASAFDYSLAKHKQIVIVGAPGAEDTRKLLRLVGQRYLPNRTVMLADGGRRQQELAKFLSVVSSMKMKDGKATAYVCENYVCNLPTADANVVARLLDAR